MKRLPLLFLFLLSFVPSLSAQTVGVTGHTKIGNGNALTSGTFMRFRLRNFSGNTPRVIGTGTIVQTQFDVTPDNTGLVSTNIYANDDITPVNTFWTVEQWFNGVFVASYNYGICRAVQLSYCTGLNSLFNLDTQTPISFPTPPQPYLPIPGPAGPAGPQGPPGNGSPSGITVGPISIRGPIPWRDVTSYMPFNNGTFCSSTTPVNGTDTTGTISSGSTSLSLAAARDFKNGCGIAVLGAGPTSTLPTPPTTATVASAARSGGNVTLTFTGTPPAGLPVPFGGAPNGFGLVVSGCSDASYNGTFLVQSATGGSGWTLSYFTGGGNGTATSCTVAFIFGSTRGVTGSTTYKYQVTVCDLNFGCSPASSTLTITNANATLTKNNYNYISYPENTNGAYWLLYSDKGLGGALTCVNTSVSMAMIDIGGYNPCPSWAPTNPPVSATAQALFTTISSGAGTTTLTVANAASNNATTQNVYHDESSFLNSCITDANNDLNVNSTQLGGGYGCYAPQGVYGMNGPLKTASLTPNGSLNIYVAGTLNFQTEPWMILKSGYQILGIGSGGQVGTVGARKQTTAIKFGPNVPYGFVVGTNSVTTVKGFQMQLINGTGVFIGATNYSNGASSVAVEDMNIVEQGATGNAPCLTIDDNSIGIYVTNFSCQGVQAAGGMPAFYITHTPFGSLVNQILRFNGVNSTFRGWKIDGPGGNGSSAAIHDIQWTDSFSESFQGGESVIQLDNGSGAIGGSGWALQGMSIDQVIVSDSSASGLFSQMSPTNNMPVSAIEVKNSYIGGTGVTCIVVTQCQQFAINNVSSLGVGITNFPTGQNGVITGASVGGGAGVLMGTYLGIVPGQANFGASPATDMPWIIYLTPPNPNNISSTGAGSLAAGVYCNSFTGLDANSYETGATNVKCQTVGASSSIVYDFSGGGQNIAAYSGYNFYYCFTASGTCTPNQRFTSVTNVTDGGAGRLYTFSTTAGSGAATPPTNGAAMLSWLANDPTNPPLSCFMCVSFNSDSWPIGFGMLPTAGAGYNLYTKLGVNVGGKLTVGGQTLCTNLDNIRCVNSSTAGADLGAKVNTADATLGSNPGEIWIDSSAGTTWTTATTFGGPRRVVFLNGTYTIPTGNLVLTQPVNFDCQTKYQVLTFTGTGVAFKFLEATANLAYQDWGAGIENCTIYGPGGFSGGAGNAGTGIQIGDATHVAVGVYVKNTLVSGFTTGLTWGSSTSWGLKTDHSTFANNTQELVWNFSTASGMENVRFDHTVFTTFTSGVGVNTNGIQISGTSNLDMGFTDCSFDSEQFNLSAANSIVSFNNHHFEVNATTNSTTVPFLMSAGHVQMLNPQFYQDFTSGSIPAHFVNQSGGSLTLVGPYFSTNSAMTDAVTNSGSATTAMFGAVGLVGTFSSGYFNPTVNPFFNVGDFAGAANFGGTGTVNFLNAPVSVAVGLKVPFASNTGLQIFNTTTTCTTGNTVGATCTTGAISLPVAEADTSYRVTCAGKGLTNVPVVIATANTSASQFTITIAALTAAAASFASYDCIAGHN